LVIADGRTDINDVYAFVDGDNTVLVMTVNPLAGVLSPMTLRPSARYEFLIDNDGDAIEDKVYRVQAGAPGTSGQQNVFAYDVGALRPRLGGGMTNTDITLQDGSHLFVGLRDDPFFFDLVAFLDQVKGAGGSRTFCDGNENDFFAGANITAIVLQVPSDNLTGDSSVVRIWGRTADRAATIDRMGLPAIATVLIPDGSEDAFNATAPAADVATWSGDVSASLQFLSGLDGSGYSAAEADFIASLLLPDVLTVDTNSEDGFVPGLNGRRLEDDVIDFELFVVTGGLGADNPPAGTPVLTSDCVDANDVPFLSAFPYLAPAQ
jgi:hypothetical protein